MRRQETIPIGYVDLKPQDLAEIALRILRLHQQRIDEAAAEYDDTTKTGEADRRDSVKRRNEWLGEIEEALARYRSQEAGEVVIGEAEKNVASARESLADAKAGLKDYGEDRAANRDDVIATRLEWRQPKFAVATSTSSFEDRDWSHLWSRVSSRDVRSITMEGSGLHTKLEVDLSLLGRLTSAYTNRVNLTSTDGDEFDRERGYFTNLLRDRDESTRRRLTTGWLSWLIWYVIPAFLITAVVVVGFSIVTGDGSSGPTRLIRTLVYGLGTLLFVAVLGGQALGALAPRVTVAGAGPHAEARGLLVQIAIAIISGGIVSLVFLLGPELTRQ